MSNSNSPIQDFVHPDDETQPTFEFIHSYSVLYLAFLPNDTIKAFKIFQMVFVQKKFIAPLTTTFHYSFHSPVLFFLSNYYVFAQFFTKTRFT